jgi:hypothetical protein
VQCRGHELTRIFEHFAPKGAGRHLLPVIYKYSAPTELKLSEPEDKFSAYGELTRLANGFDRLSEEMIQWAN